MAKTLEAPPQIRKSFVIAGAAVLGVAVLFFLLSKFVFGGGDTAAPGTASQTSGQTSTVATPAPQVPAIDTGLKPATTLKDGGRDPFSPRANVGAAAPAPQAAAAPAAAAVPAAATGTDVSHTWQLLDLKDGKATFLVDGKKHAGVSVPSVIVKEYTFHSVTGTCVTVAKGPSIFGLCPGAAPITA